MRTMLGKKQEDLSKMEEEKLTMAKKNIFDRCISNEH